MKCGGVIYMIYPIVEYARKIGKNTAEFTTIDMVNFMKWWMKQPQREEVMTVIKQRQEQSKKIGEHLQEIKQFVKDNTNMAKKHTTASFQAAQTSRLAEQGIESPINDGQEEIVIHEEDEIICSMELTKVDVAALLFSIHRTFADYEMNEDHEYTASLKSLQEGLEGV